MHFNRYHFGRFDLMLFNSMEISISTKSAERKVTQVSSIRMGNLDSVGLKKK